MQSSAMIPVKVECGCGQHYAFDVEPVNGRMPASVACPVCGADGTVAANENIAQAFAERLPTNAAATTTRLRAATPPIASPIPRASTHTISPSSPVQRLSQQASFQQGNPVSTEKRPSPWRFAFWIGMFLALSLFLWQQAVSGRRWISLPGVLLTVAMLCRLSGQSLRPSLLRRTLNVAEWIFFAGFAATTVRLVLTE
jgi:hypothetical protein